MSISVSLPFPANRSAAQKRYAKGSSETHDWAV